MRASFDVLCARTGQVWSESVGNFVSPNARGMVGAAQRKWVNKRSSVAGTSVLYPTAKYLPPADRGGLQTARRRPVDNV